MVNRQPCGAYTERYWIEQEHSSFTVWSTDSRVVHVLKGIGLNKNTVVLLSSKLWVHVAIGNYDMSCVLSQILSLYGSFYCCSMLIFTFGKSIKRKSFYPLILMVMIFYLAKIN